MKLLASEMCGGGFFKERKPLLLAPNDKALAFLSRS